MGLFKWIKKELELKSLNKRRESAPPSLMTGNFDANLTRDEAYLKALNKFNEYRTAQRLERLSIDGNNSTTTNYYHEDEQQQQQHHPIYQRILKEETDEDDDDGDDDEEGDDDNSDDESDEQEKNDNMEQRHHHYQRRQQQQQQQQMDNSSSFDEIHINDKKLKTNKNDTSAAYKNYDINISSICNQNIINNNKGTNNNQRQQSNNHNNNSNSNNNNNNNNNNDSNNHKENSKNNLKKIIKNKKRTKRYSPSYQSVINKHGEIVEYALPYIEQNFNDNELINDNSNKLSTSINKISDNFDLSCRNFNEIINKNFFFLDDTNNMNFTNEPSIIEPMKTYLERKYDNSTNMIITDLDKSNDSNNIKFDKIDGSKSNRDIFNELDSLKNWSTTIHMSNPINQSLDFIDNNDIIICHLNDIQNRIGILKNCLPSPMEFSSGIFRNTNVCFRKNRINLTQTINVAESASRRDLKILSQMKHPNIALLMAVCYEKSIITLIMEPFDFTLNYLLYQTDKELNLFHSISIVQQITSAVIYLQESNLIHSNISSHCILIRKFPFCAKLSCFELTTEIIDEKHNEIELLYENDIKINEQNRQLDYDLHSRNNQLNLYEKYKRMSKYSSILRNTNNNDFNFDMNISIKHLPYNINYRQKFSLHFYQAPELLTTTKRFIFPTKNSDIYSLTLLLWEIINKCVPFILFNYNELEELYKHNNAKLPIFNYKLHKIFERIYEYGLNVIPTSRIMNVQHFYSHLEFIKNDLLMKNLIKDTTNNIFITDNEKEMNEQKLNDDENCPILPLRKNQINDKNIQNLIEKKLQCKEYFNSNPHQYINVAMDSTYKRLDNQNQLTEQNIKDIGFIETIDGVDQTNIFNYSADQENTNSEQNDTKKNSYVSIMELDNDETPIKLPKTMNSSHFNREDFIRKIEDDFKKEPETPQKLQKPLEIIEKKITDSIFNTSNFTNNSILDFNKFLSSNQDGKTYERTSTVKKKKKKNYETKTKLLAKDLFNVGSTENDKCKNFDKIDNELNAISDNIKYSKNDILTEFEENKQKKGKKFYDTNSMTRYDILEPNSINNDSSNKMNKLFSTYETPTKYNKHNYLEKTNKSIDNLLNKYDTPNHIKYNINKTSLINSCPQQNSSYRFSVGQFTLPDTPIARKNKIRRNAWLSDQKINITTEKSGNNFNKITKQTIENFLKKDEQINNELIQDDENKNKKLNLNHQNVQNKSIIINNNDDCDDDDLLQPNEKITDLSSDISKCFTSKVFNDLFPDFTTKIVKELEIKEDNQQDIKTFDSSTKKFNSTPSIVNSTLKRPVTTMEKKSDENLFNFQIDQYKKPFNSSLEIKPYKSSIDQYKNPFNASIDQYKNPYNSPIDYCQKPHNSSENKYQKPFNSPVDNKNTRAEQNLFMKMPEILKEALEKQQERKESRKEIFENSLWRKEKELCDKSMNQESDIDEGNIIIPKRTSVREKIMKLEEKFKNSNEQNDKITINKNNVTKNIGNKKLEDIKKTDNEIETVLEKIEPMTKEEKVEKDIISEKTKTITTTIPLNVSINSSNLLSLPPVITIRQGRQTLIKRTFLRESILSNLSDFNNLSEQTGMRNSTGGGRKKITTRVTVNFLKTERRSSDNGNLKIKAKINNVNVNGDSGDIKTLPRHSICCNSDDLRKTINIKQIENNKNEIPSSSSCKVFDLVPHDSFLALDEKLRNMTCYKCNTKLDNNQTTSVNGTTSIDNVKDLSGKTLIYYHPTLKDSSKSIEDLYIDDDFQGFRLGANMELIPDTDLFSTIDFDILSEEYSTETSDDKSDNEN